MIFRAMIFVVATMLAAPSVVHADDKDIIIDKVIKAYGGEKLTSLRSLILKDQYKSISQFGRRSDEGDVSRLHSTLTVDFETGRKAVKNWSVNRNGKRLSQIMFDGEKGWSINFLRGSHVERPDLNGDNVGAGMLRLLDTTVAHMLVQHRESAQLKGPATLDVQDSHRLTFKIGGKREVTLWVDNQSSLIRQMTLGSAKYVYSEYRSDGGLTYASSTDMFRGGKPRMVTLSRKIIVNPDITNAFHLPSNTMKLDGMQDRSLMQINVVSDGVYLVGQKAAASVFVDAGDYYIGAGAMRGFQDRLDALNKHLGTKRPVKFQVLPEFQRDFSGVNEIAAHGAIFVTVENHLGPLKSRLKDELPDERFLLVEGLHEFDGGRAQVYEIETVQSEQYLLFYIPDANMVFTVHEFGTQLLNSVPSPNRNMISFRRALEALEIDVEKIGYSHSAGMLTMEQLRQVTDSYTEGKCPAGHEICQY